MAGVAEMLLYTVSMSLFLIEWGAERLPLVYLGTMVLSVLITSLYLTLQKHFPLARLLPLSTAAVIALLLLFYALYQATESRWVTLTLPIFSAFYSVLKEFEFWGATGHLLTLRQGKRLFGLISVGKLLAFTLGGLLIPVLMIGIAPAHLLLGAALTATLLFFIIRRLIRDYTVLSRLNIEEDTPDGKPVALWKQPYILLIFIFAALGIFVYYFNDNIFFFYASEHYSDSAALTGFISIVEAASGALTLVMTLFLSERLVSRFGMTSSLVAYPFFTGLLALPLFALGHFGGGTALLPLILATLLRFADRLSWEVLSAPAAQLLYQPLPPAQRVQAQTSASGIVAAIAGGAAALLLLLLDEVFSFRPFDLAGALILLTLVTVVVAVLAVRQYPAMLMQALHKRHLGTMTISLSDPTTRRVLDDALASQHPGQVLYALDLLRDAVGAEGATLLPPLLAHPEEEVRLAALREMERVGTEALRPVLTRTVRDDPSARVRGVALRVLASYPEMDVAALLVPFLEHPDPPLRQGATVGLLHHGGLEGMLAGGQQLLEWVRSPDPTERGLAAEVIGQTGVQALQRSLRPLLDDPSLAVRQSAIVAAGQLHAPTLWPALIAALAVPSLRSAASAALESEGPALLPLLEHAWKTQPSPALRTQVVRIVARIGGEEARGCLVGWMRGAQGDLLTQGMAALSRAGYHALSPDERAWIEARLHEEVARTTRLLALATDLSDEATRPLQRALNDEMEAGQARVLWLLSFLYDSAAVWKARDHLQHPDPQLRAYAGEILDLLLPSEQKGWLLPLFEELPPDARLQRLRAFFPLAQPPRRVEEQIQALCDATDVDPWTRGCAFHTLARLAPAAATLLAPQAAHSGEPLLEEIARGLLAAPLPRSAALPPHEVAMLSTVEKVLILKTVSIFAETPDRILVEVAHLLQEEEVPAGQTIIQKGEFGTSLYIIARGRVRVHDGERLLNELGDSEVFGEMAALDPSPRSASVTALEESYLFRLEQRALFDVMADRVEIALGIVRVLSRHLRRRVEDVATLHQQLKELQENHV